MKFRLRQLGVMSSAALAIVAALFVPAPVEATLTMAAGPRHFASQGGGGGEGLECAIDGVEITPDVFAGDTALGSGNGSSWANRDDFVGALAAATAGTDICVDAGHYTAPMHADVQTPIFRTTNEGTAGNPIRIIGRFNPLEYCEDGSCTSEENLTRLGATNPFYDPTCNANWNTNSATFGTPIGQDYVEWYSIYADQSDDAPPGPGSGALFIGGSHTKYGQIVIRLVHPVNHCDNFNGIHASGADDIEVKRVYLFDDQTESTGNHNTCAFTIYNTTNFLVENITVEGTECGVFDKGGDNGTIRYSLFKDMVGTCVDMGVNNATSDDALVTQNVCIRAAICWRFDASAPGENWNRKFIANTCIDPLKYAGVEDSGCFFAQQDDTVTGGEFRDNLCVFLSATSALMVDIGTTTTTAVFDDFDHNQYSEAGGAASYRFNTGSNQNFAAFDAALGGSFENNSDETAPDFVNSASDDFRRDDSPADNGASDGGPRGAYKTGNELIGAHAQ